MIWNPTCLEMDNVWQLPWILKRKIPHMLPRWEIRGIVIEMYILT